MRGPASRSRDSRQAAAPQGRPVRPPRRRRTPCCAPTGGFLQQGRHALRSTSTLGSTTRRSTVPTKPPARQTAGARGPPRHRRSRRYADDVALGKWSIAEQVQYVAGQPATDGSSMWRTLLARARRDVQPSSVIFSRPDLVLHADGYNLVRWWPPIATRKSIEAAGPSGGRGARCAFQAGRIARRAGLSAGRWSASGIASAATCASTTPVRDVVNGAPELPVPLVALPEEPPLPGV